MEYATQTQIDECLREIKFAEKEHKESADIGEIIYRSKPFYEPPSKEFYNRLDITRLLWKKVQDLNTKYVQLYNNLESTVIARKKLEAERAQIEHVKQRELEIMSTTYKRIMIKQDKQIIKRILSK